jgi:hypothetical protein
VTDLGTPWTRWRHRETGELLVAIAAKGAGDECIVLPVGECTHPLDWMGLDVFLRAYERTSG